MANRPAQNFDLSQIQNGDRVTILVPAGIGRNGQEWKESTGRAIMRGPHGWVLNMGGRYGTPGIAGVENTVKVRKARVYRAERRVYRAERPAITR
jgi:hypothetical protein